MTSPIAQLRRIYHNPKSLFWISVILLAVSLLMTGLSLWAVNKEEPAPQGRAITALPLNSAITQGVVTVKVQDASRNDGKGTFRTPPDKEYVVLSFTVQNNSDAPIQILPTNDTYIKDLNGNVSYVTPYELADPFRAGELPPGEIVKGQLSYLVHKGQKHKLYIDAIWSGGVIPFDVN